MIFLRKLSYWLLNGHRKKLKFFGKALVIAHNEKVVTSEIELCQSFMATDLVFKFQLICISRTKVI